MASLFSLALIATACGSDDSSGESGETGSTTGSTATEGSTGEDAMNTTAGGGGTLTFGAEQEPECMDWINICAGSSWGAWMVLYQTLPRAYDFAQEGEGWVYEPSILLEGEAEVTENPQTVTYKINPDAVWDDGTPITCKDFIYTWDQVANGTDVYDPTGYSSVSGVEATDDRTCVATFSAPYAGWKKLFGGNYGVQPAHLLEGP
jgi:peptide/nickel transport system substrate-binding protein